MAAERVNKLASWAAFAVWMAALAGAVVVMLRPGGRGRQVQVVLPADSPAGTAAPAEGLVSVGNLQIRRANIKLGEQVPLHPLLVLKAHEIDEPELVAWLDAWQQRINHGQATTAQHMAELEAMLKETRLSCMGLYQIGRGMALVAGKDDAALPWYRAAARRAQRDVKGTDASRYTPAELIAALGRMRDAMWPSNDWATIQLLDGAQVMLEPPR